MLFISKANSQPVNPVTGKESTVEQWVNENFAKGKIPPFSFKYGGIDSKAFITGWKYSAERQVSNDPDIHKSVYTYTDTKTGISAKCFVTSYSDFPAVEWGDKICKQIRFKYSTH